MTVTRKEDDGNSETAFAILMVVLSVFIFLAIRNSEKSGSGSP